MSARGKESKQKDRNSEVPKVETNKTRVNEAAAAARRAREIEEERGRKAQDAQYSATVRFARSSARSRSSSARRAGR